MVNTMRVEGKNKYHAEKINLRSVPVFESLSDAEMGQIENQSVEKFYKPKTGIIQF